MDKIKLIIADDSKEECEFLRQELEKYEDIEILGIANTDTEEIEMIENLKPEIVITDLMRNGKYTGFDIIKEYYTKEYSPKFLIVTCGTPTVVFTKYSNIAGFMHKLGINYNEVIIELRKIKKEIENEKVKQEKLNKEKTEKMEIKKKSLFEKMFCLKH